MAASSSANEQTASTLMLKIKPNQNMIVDLDSSRYNKNIRPITECLKFSRISEALTKHASVPLVHLSSAYSSAFYNKKEEIITFEVASVKTHVSKSRFGKLLGFTETENLIDPESLQPVVLQKRFYQMGYKGDIDLLSKFTKKGLPPYWNALFTILFKSFSERTTGTDSTSKPFYTLFYGVYHDLNLDYDSILWNHFVDNINYKNRHSEISCARFWSIVVQRNLTKHNIHIVTDFVMATIPILPTGTFVTTNSNDFEFISSIPLEMTNRVPIDVKCVATYCKIPPSGLRLITPKRQEAFDKLENPKKVVKRKGKGSTSETVKPTKPRKKIKKAKSPTPPSKIEESEGRTLSDPLKGNQGGNKEEDDTRHIGQKPPSPLHDPTPKSTPKPTPNPTPNNSPSPSRKNSPEHTPHNSPSPSPKNTTKPSPTHQSPSSDEEEMFIFDEQYDVTGFVDSPFNVHLNVDDNNASMTKGQFKEGEFRTGLLPRCKGGKIEEGSGHGKRVLVSVVSQNKALRGCASDIDSYLRRIVEDSDPILTPNVRLHLTNKLHPVLTLLSKLKVVSEGDATPKQGGDEHMETPNENMDTSNASKENQENPTKPFISKISNVNEPGTNPYADETNQEKKTNWFTSVTSDNAGSSKRRDRDHELDYLQKLTRELDAKEVALRDAEFLLKTRKSLFPDCPFTEFIFVRGLKPVNEKIFKFYLDHSKPQYISWNLKKIIILTPKNPEIIAPFKNARFLARRGDKKEPDEFSMADLPFMNPFDWISMFTLLKKKPDKHEPLIKHLKRMIASYIYEVSKLDLEVATRLNSKPLYKIQDPPSGFSNRKTGKIDNTHWNVVFSSREGGMVLRKQRPSSAYNSPFPCIRASLAGHHLLQLSGCGGSLLDQDLQGPKNMADGEEDLPRDANILKTLLKSMGVDHYEHRVVHQFLELWYRYVVDVLTDAQVYSEHAGKSTIDSDDVKIAIQSKSNSASPNPLHERVKASLSNPINVSSKRRLTIKRLKQYLDNLFTEILQLVLVADVVTSIHESWFCGRCMNTSNPAGEGCEQGIPPVNKNLKDPDGWIVSLSKKLAMWWPWCTTDLFKCNLKSGNTFPTLDPRTGQLIADVTEGELEDVNCAVAAARKAFDEGPWRRMAAYERSPILFGFADLVEKHADEITGLEVWDNGKPYEQAARDEIPLFIRWADKIHVFTIQADGPHHVQTLHEPIGVAGQIIPWNFPLLMFSWKVGPALACGNTIVLKTPVYNNTASLTVGNRADDAVNLHHIVHCSLDVVDEKVNNPKKSGTMINETFLGLLYPTENYKVYGYLTNTKVKFILVTTDLDVRDADVRNINPDSARG
ncbi:hypothetical protein L2E82_04572 [Cichorium intybus]|uniref:Uncharacterized protein n=1 Tax=Cichorium intybus TaxID=13427 RepID=A0ACB9H697_CICIN|nr:hypothetical protein L2E82_04572 [Cichorium intybus]